MVPRNAIVRMHLNCAFFPTKGKFWLAERLRFGWDRNRSQKWAAIHKLAQEIIVSLRTYRKESESGLMPFTTVYKRNSKFGLVS